MTINILHFFNRNNIFVKYYNVLRRFDDYLIEKNCHTFENIFITMSVPASVNCSE